jgi:transposase-like protein
VFRRRTLKTVLTCPQCGSADLYYETGLITGYKYHCKKCNYIGAFVIEKDMKEDKKDAGD